MQNAKIDDRPFTVLRVGNMVWYVAERYEPDFGYIIKRCYIEKVPQRKGHKQFCIISDDNCMYWTEMKNMWLSPDAARAEAKRQADHYDKVWNSIGMKCRRYFNEEEQKEAFTKKPLVFDDDEEEEDPLPDEGLRVPEERGMYVQMCLDNDFAL